MQLAKCPKCAEGLAKLDKIAALHVKIDHAAIV